MATAEQVDEIGLEVGTARPDRPILPRLAGCRLWYSGHDDCYAWMESADRGMPLAVLGRLLALLVGSALVDTGVVTVADPSGIPIEDLLEQSPDWVGTLGTASVDIVTQNLAVTSGPWRPAQQLLERGGSRRYL